MHFEQLKSALSGQWEGTKQLYFSPPPAPGISSSSKMSIEPVAGGSFLQCTYDWSYEGDAQSGVLLLGSDEENIATAAWVDSFHMSSKIMFSKGTAEAGSLHVRGSYEAPPGPDWGWTIAVRALSATEFQIVMHNVSPEGQEDLAVQIDYVRSH